MNLLKIKKISLKIETESFGKPGKVDVVITDKDNDSDPEVDFKMDLPGDFADFDPDAFEVPVGTILKPIIDLVASVGSSVAGPAGPAVSMVVKALKSLIP